jgi:hypothetical protein
MNNHCPSNENTDVERGNENQTKKEIRRRAGPVRNPASTGPSVHYNELQTAPIAIDHARKLLESITTKVKQPHFKAWRVKGMLDLENFSPNHTQPIIIIDLPKHCWVYTGTGEDGDFTYETQDLDVGLMVRMAKKAWVDLTPKASMLTASRPPIQADKLGIQKWLQHEVQKTTNPQETT